MNRMMNTQKRTINIVGSIGIWGTWARGSGPAAVGSVDMVAEVYGFTLRVGGIYHEG